jgi:hypothetical protein
MIQSKLKEKKYKPMKVPVRLPEEHAKPAPVVKTAVPK